MTDCGGGDDDDDVMSDDLLGVSRLGIGEARG